MANFVRLVKYLIVCSIFQHRFFYKWAGVLICMREKTLVPHFIKARDLPDLWFQAVNDIQDNGRRFKIDKGSYAGQTRLEFDFFVGHIANP